VKDFCGRMRENSGIRHQTIPKSHGFGYETPPVSSTKILNGVVRGEETWDKNVVPAIHPYHFTR